MSADRAAGLWSAQSSLMGLWSAGQLLPLPKTEQLLAGFQHLQRLRHGNNPRHLRLSRPRVCTTAQARTRCRLAPHKTLLPGLRQRLQMRLAMTWSALGSLHCCYRSPQAGPLRRQPAIRFVHPIEFWVILLSSRSFVGRCSLHQRESLSRPARRAVGVAVTSVCQCLVLARLACGYHLETILIAYCGRNAPETTHHQFSRGWRWRCIQC